MNSFRVFMSLLLALFLFQAPVLAVEKKKVKINTVGKFMNSTEGDGMYFKPDDKELPVKLHLLKDHVEEYKTLAGKRVRINGTAKTSEYYSLIVYIANVTAID